MTAPPMPGRRQRSDIGNDPGGTDGLAAPFHLHKEVDHGRRVTAGVRVRRGPGIPDELREQRTDLVHPPFARDRLLRKVPDPLPERPPRRMPVPGPVPVAPPPDPYDVSAAVREALRQRRPLQVG
ncbi:hypothetical protein AB0A70_09930 [Streptomyces morookaense]|uniref:hypothetical protein n=1 Tax=Streptomyces morookaense TaxID=1970 RepID=UPI0033E83EAD